MLQALRTKDANHYLHQVQNFNGALGSYSARPKNDYSIPGTIKTIKAGRFINRP
jgi:hypothetical protein